MRNVTISVEDDVARWARVYAAQHDTSVSRILGEMLQERMEKEEGYATAQRRYMVREPRALKSSGSYPSRDEVHES